MGKLTNSLLPASDETDHVYWFMPGGNTVLSIAPGRGKNGDPRQGDRRNLCTGNKKCLCCSCFLHFQCSLYAQEVLEKEQSEPACQAGFSKLSQLRSCTVTLRQIIYGCFQALQYHNNVFWALFFC